MCTYRIEFGNGDVIETKRLGMGIPEIQTCDLNGDGVKEIPIQLSYGFEQIRMPTERWHCLKRKWQVRTIDAAGGIIYFYEWKRICAARRE